MKNRVVSLVDEVRKELENDILPFWINKMVDNVNGGFYGQITGEDVLCPEASKGAILNARILWKDIEERVVSGNCFKSKRLYH